MPGRKRTYDDQNGRRRRRRGCRFIEEECSGEGSDSSDDTPRETSDSDAYTVLSDEITDEGRAMAQRMLLDYMTRRSEREEQAGLQRLLRDPDLVRRLQEAQGVPLTPPTSPMRADTAETIVIEEEVEEDKKASEPEEEKLPKSYRATAWCFTQHGYDMVNEDWKDGAISFVCQPSCDELDRDFVKVLQDQQVQYMVWQGEKGEEKERPHVQGYVVFESRISFKTAKSRLVIINGGYEDIHVEKSRGNCKQNIIYCTKVDGRLCGPWEYGTRPAQGARTDLHDAYQALRQGEKVIHVIDKRPHLFPLNRHMSEIQHMLACEKMIINKEKVSEKPPFLIWFFGVPGCGKTQTALRAFTVDGEPDYHIMKAWNDPFAADGYQNQKAIIFDDIDDALETLRNVSTFKSDNKNLASSHTKFLSQVNNPAATWNVKGSTIHLRNEFCIFTSMWEPFTDEDSVDYGKISLYVHPALARRVHAFVKFRDDDKLDVVFNQVLIDGTKWSKAPRKLTLIKNFDNCDEVLKRGFCDGDGTIQTDLWDTWSKTLIEKIVNKINKKE